MSPQITAQIEATKKRLKNLDEKTRRYLDKYSKEDRLNYNIKLSGYPMDIALDEIDLDSKGAYNTKLFPKKRGVRNNTRLLIANILGPEQSEITVSFETIDENTGVKQQGAAEMFDISQDGVSFISDMKLKEGQILYVYFKFGKTKNTPDFFEKAEIRYVKGRKYGLKFVNPSQKLKNYVKDTFAGLRYGIHTKR